MIALNTIQNLEEEVEISSESKTSLCHNTEQKTRNFTSVKTRTYKIILNIVSP
jgi:hypothetical protein